MTPLTTTKLSPAHSKVIINIDVWTHMCLDVVQIVVALSIMKYELVINRYIIYSGLIIK